MLPTEAASCRTFVHHAKIQHVPRLRHQLLPAASNAPKESSDLFARRPGPIDVPGKEVRNTTRSRARWRA